MKTAIYIEDGVVQLILTPQNEFERNTIKSITDKDLQVNTFNGTFYDCHDGWIRQEQYYPEGGIYGSKNEDKSIIIRVEEKEEPIPQPADIESNLRIIEVSKNLIPSMFGIFPEQITVLNIQDPTKKMTAEYKFNRI